MANFKTFLSAKSSRRSHDNDLAENDHSSGVKSNTSTNRSNSAPKMRHKRDDSTRLMAGVQKVFGYHRRNNSVPPSSDFYIPSMTSMPTPATCSSTSKRLYRFRSPKQKTYATSTPPSPSTANNTTMLSSMVPSSTPPTKPITPPTSTHSETSMPNERHVSITSVTSRTKSVTHPTRPGVDTQADLGFPTDTDTPADTRPVLRTTSHPVAVESTHDSPDAYADELEAALADRRAAEKLLAQRHAAIMPRANTSERLKPLGIVLKKKGTGDGHNIARLPSSLSPSTLRRTSLRTANQEIEALRRRKAIKDLTFFAADGCPTNIDIMDQINAHFHLQARHADGDIPDATFNVNGISIRASEMPKGSVERNWIIRYNAVVNNAELVERRLMNSEDHEMIVAQLFPEDRRHILKPEHFEIFMHGLGEEGILTKAQAKSIATVAVSLEEFEQGVHYVQDSRNKHAHRRNTTAAAIFDIPRQASRGVSSFPYRQTNGDSQHELYHYLRILVEAAVYDQKFWKGYFFPNARSRFNDFYEAYKITQENWLLPPNLTDYKREWTHREIRLLYRGQLICNLLKQYEAGEITDFGIVRAVRATFVGIPAQPSWCPEDLESFLYHRINESGLAISKIPEILALHPEHDTTFANYRLRQHVINGLRERAEQFEKEEATRLKEIDKSYMTFEHAKRKGMTRWERMKEGLKKAFGKKQIVVPFDPFAPDHAFGG
ncbi:hypothetical protein AA0113_g7481 [Alternaria arborescens]|uniref:Uncharacterized protein n=1 Tax=Alternaria arborescens TaxID=156630 RepID=A0A4Q4RRG2_9PLEO|nr:hypothetical protein AA0113_g7481 [Alternaria arborescens]